MNFGRKKPPSITSEPGLKLPDPQEEARIREQLGQLAVDPRKEVNPILSKLQQIRAEKVESVKQLELEIEELSREIDWLDRHPEGEKIIQAVIGRFTPTPGDWMGRQRCGARRVSTDKPCTLLLHHGGQHENEDGATWFQPIPDPPNVSSRTGRPMP